MSEHPLFKFLRNHFSTKTKLILTVYIETEHIKNIKITRNETLPSKKRGSIINNLKRQANIPNIQNMLKN
jgi:hypothetical protein